MKIKCMIEETKYNNKPQGKEIGTIQNNMKPIDITVEELASKMVQGCSFRPALLNGKCNEDWVSQQLLALDFDEDTTIEEELNRCKELGMLPAFGYTSFSHTEQQHKFRLVFVFSECVYNVDTMNDIFSKFKELFPKVDMATLALSKLFFGGRKLIYEEYNNRIDVRNMTHKDIGERVTNILNEYSNTSNIIVTLNPLDDYYNLKAIRDRNVDYLKQQFGQTHIEFNNDAEFWYYVYRINLPMFLGIGRYKTFKCLFHDDNNPSAGMFENEEGVWLYKCHSPKCQANKVMNVKQVIELLGNFKSEHKSIQFIKDVFNLSIKESKWSIEQKGNLDRIVDSLSLGEFAKVCPQANKNIRYVKDLFLSMVRIARKNVYGENYCNSDGDAVFFASLSEIANSMGKNTDNLNRISQRLSTLIYHDLIRKLDDDKIPPEMLAKAQAISIDREYKKRINFYCIPSWVFSQLNIIEDQGVKWKENNYTIKGVSYEMFYRKEGIDVAQYIYPQHKKISNSSGQVVDRTTSLGSDKKTLFITHVLFELLNKYQYTTEASIIDYIYDTLTTEDIDSGFVVDIKIKIDKDMYENITKVLSKEGIKTQLKKSLPEILDSYDLQRVRANKELKEKYGVTSNGYPFLILKNEG